MGQLLSVVPFSILAIIATHLNKKYRLKVYIWQLSPYMWLFNNFLFFFMNKSTKVQLRTLSAVINKISTDWEQVAPNIKDTSDAPLLSIIKKEESARKLKKLYAVKGMYYLLKNDTVSFAEKKHLEEYKEHIDNNGEIKLSEFGEDVLVNITNHTLSRLAKLYYLRPANINKHTSLEEWSKKRESIADKLAKKTWEDVTLELEDQHFIKNTMWKAYTLKKRGTKFVLASYNIKVSNSNHIDVESSHKEKYTGRLKIRGIYGYAQLDNINPDHKSMNRTLTLCLKGSSGTGKEHHNSPIKYIEGIITGPSLSSDIIWSNIILLEKITTKMTPAVEYPFFSIEALNYVKNKDVIKFLSNHNHNIIRTSVGGVRNDQTLKKEIPLKNIITQPIKHILYISFPMTSISTKENLYRPIIQKFVDTIIEKSVLERENIHIKFLSVKSVRALTFESDDAVDNIRHSKNHLIILPTSINTGSFVEACLTFVYNTKFFQKNKPSYLLVDQDIELPSFFNKKIHPTQTAWVNDNFNLKEENIDIINTDEELIPAILKFFEIELL